MIAIVSTLIFAGALLASVGVIAASVVPQWQRIVRTLNGTPDMPTRPLQQLVLAERRIAVIRWSAASRPAPALLHAAA